MIRKFTTTIFALFLIVELVEAQSDSGFNNLMYSSGKIYNVVGVIILIFIGIAIYLFRIDKRLSKIEEQ